MDIAVKFLVIGGAGLIGSHTVDALQEDVGEVIVFDNFVRGRLENLESARQDPRFKVYDIGGDILQSDILQAAMQGIDGVFHLAALWFRSVTSFLVPLLMSMFVALLM